MSDGLPHLSTCMVHDDTSFLHVETMNLILSFLHEVRDTHYELFLRTVVAIRTEKMEIENVRKLILKVFDGAPLVYGTQRATFKKLQTIENLLF